MMSVLWLLIPLAVLFAGVFVFWFAQMSRSGQFDDLETPAHRILLPENKEKT
jgi:cbb3-type cytochrome oxidase maturation protein